MAMRGKAKIIERLVKNGIDIETILKETQCTRQDVYNVRHHLKTQAELKKKPKRKAEVKYIFRNADGDFETESVKKTAADPVVDATKQLIKAARQFGLKVRIEFYSE